MSENDFGSKTRSHRHKCSLCIYFISLLDAESKINLKQQGLSHWNNITYYFRVTIELWADRDWDVTLPTEVRLVKAMVFQVVTYGCESWTVKKARKNWCFWTVVLEKTLESPLDCKEIQPVHPKGDQSWVFIGRTDAEAETPILWPPYAKSWLIGKDPDAGRDWGQEEKGMTEDQMAEWHYWLNGHEFG